MATYAQMKARIASEMVRDDIASGGDSESILETHIAQACEYYADRKFWFNSILTTATTSASTATVSIPATVRIVERVTIPAYDIQLREVILRKLDDDTDTGLPCRYSYYNNSLRFWPIPDQAYTLNIYGIAQVDAPSSDSDENIWTTEAYNLIVGHTKMTLARGLFRDTDGALLWQAEVQDALSRLQRETAKRLDTPLGGRSRGRYRITSDTYN